MKINNIPFQITHNHFGSFVSLRDAFKTITLATQRPPLIPNYHLVLTFFFLLLTNYSFPNILTVKQDGTGDYTKIQDAINMASWNNDTILVWPGTYYENINFLGKDLVLASLYLTTGDRHYIYNTIIDGNKNGCVITLQNQETLASVICGFIIQNGKKDFSTSNWNKYGCGIMLFQSSATISNNIIQLNESFGGGGLCSFDGIVKLYGNIIKNNHSYNWGGGILYTNDEIPVYFDTLNLNSVYLNFANLGGDITVRSIGQPQVIEIDTLTVFNPDLYFVISSDGYSTPINDLTVNVRNQKIEPVAADLFVSPVGNNTNSGIDPQNPLQSICFAMSKIQPDSLQQRTIHILPGTYSPQATGERLPIGGRSNIKLSGNNMANTIVDCQYNGYFYSGWYLKNVEIENLTILHGFGAILSPTFLTDGGIQVYLSNKVIISNVKIDSTLNASHQCTLCFFPDSVYIRNFQCLYSIGEQSNFFIRTMDDFPMYVRMENVKVHGNKYYDDGTGFYGGYKNIVIAGGNKNNDIVTGKLINVEISDNISWDTWYSNNCGAGWATSERVKLDIVNATIGGNSDRMNLPGTNSTVQGSQINIYNSIFYNNNSPDIYIYKDDVVNDPAEINFHYTLFENGPAGIMDGAGNTIVKWGAGILDEDPQWDTFGTNPYSLMSTSPCINTGTPMYEPGMEPPYIKQENGKYILYTHGNDTIHLPATDIAGNPRIAYGRIDMGAYEFADTTIGIKPRPQFLASGIKAIPNPFQQSTAIEFTLLKEGHYIVQIHDMQGRLLKTLLDTFTQPGNFHLRWHADDDNGNKLPSGNYIINLLFEEQNVGSLKVRRW